MSEYLKINQDLYNAGKNKCYPKFTIAKSNVIES